MSLNSPRLSRPSFPSPRSEAAPLYRPRAPISPSIPSYQRAWNPPDSGASSPALNFKREPPSRPVSYRSYVDYDEEYPLTNMDGAVYQADAELERNAKWDERLKKHIRRFRFVVRLLNLGCRYCFLIRR
jgi:hypothetical protein